MKVNTKKIVKALSTIKKFCNKKSFQDIQLSFEKNCVVLYTTDNTASLRVKVLAEGNAIDDSYIIKVGAKLFFDYVKSVSTKTVDFSVENGILYFDSFRIPVTAGEIYVPAKFGGQFVDVDVEKMLSSLEQTVYCASTDISRAILTIIEFTIDENKIKIVASDGYRLSLSEFVNNNKDFPKKQVLFKASYLDFLFDVIKLSDDENLQIVLAEKGLFFVVNGDEFVIDIYLPFENYEFVNYKGVMRAPKDDVITCEVNTENIISALNKVKNSEKVYLKVKKDSIQVTAFEELIIQEMPIKSYLSVKDYEEENYIFNTKYLVELLKTIKSKTFTMSFGKGPKTPVVVRHSGNETLIMPLFLEKGEK